MQTQWEIDNAAAQLARENELKAYYAARLAAGETPPPTTPDLAGSGEAAQPATKQVLNMFLPFAYPAIAGEFNQSMIANSFHTLPAAIQIVSDPAFNFQFDAYMIDWGITVDEPGFLELQVRARVGAVTGNAWDATEANIQMYIYGYEYGTEQRLGNLIYVYGDPTQATSVPFGGQLRSSYIDSTNFHTDPEDPTSVNNVLFGFTCDTPSSAEILGFNLLEVKVYWTPGVLA